jgi:hypothetical protein
MKYLDKSMQISSIDEELVNQLSNLKLEYLNNACFVNLTYRLEQLIEIKKSVRYACHLNLNNTFEKKSYKYFEFQNFVCNATDSCDYVSNLPLNSQQVNYI